MFFCGSMMMGGAGGGFDNRVYYIKTTAAGIGSFDAAMGDKLTSTTVTTYNRGLAVGKTYVYASDETSPYISRVPKSNISATPLVPTGGDIPPFAASTIALSPDYEYVALLSDSPGVSPYVAVMGENLDSLITPSGSDIPFALPTAIAWNSDRTKLVMGFGSSPYLGSLDFDGSSLTNITYASGANIPAGSVRDISVSRSDKIAVVGMGSPHLHTYDIDLTNKASPSGLLVSVAFAVAWHPSGDHLATTHFTSPNYRVCVINAALTARIDHTSNVGGTPIGGNLRPAFSWNNNGDKLAYYGGTTIRHLAVSDWNGVSIFNQTLPVVADDPGDLNAIGFG